MMSSLTQWLDIPLSTWLGCALILALGAFLQRITGFGLAVVGAPVLLMLEPRLVPVLLVLFGLTVSLMMVRHYWREVRFEHIGLALLGRLPGNALGIWLLLAAPMVVLEKLIAAIVLFAVLVTLCRFRLAVNRLTLFGAGILSGIFGTIAAIGGPPIALLLHAMPPDSVRGNLAAYFTLTSLLTLVTLALAGMVQLWHFQVALTLLPAVLAGSVLADAIAHRVNKRWMQRLSITLCTFAALMLLL